MICDCGSPPWQTCFGPGEIPLYPNSPEPAPGECPAAQYLDGSNVSPCAEQGWPVWFYDPVEQKGDQCCYQTETGCAVGRPFLVDDEIRTANVMLRGDWCDVPPRDSSEIATRNVLSASAKQLLVNAWLEDAQLEHASVASFARLSLELMGLGAPPALIAASQQASLDEIRHAQACFGLASSFAGECLGPAALDLTGAFASKTLEQVAVSAFREGCVGETVAALLAQEQLRVAQDPAVRVALRGIAEDETQHAELAWRVVSWALNQGGQSIALALRAAFEAELQASPSEATEQQLALEASEAQALRDHGRLSHSERAAVRVSALREVVGPCFQALLATPRTLERASALQASA